MKVWSPWNRPVPCLQGKPMPTQFSFRIVDESWNDLPVGQVGRVLVRSSTRFAGYWNNHKTWMQDHIDGWWFAGDIGRKDQDGNLHFLDREVDAVRTEQGVLYGLPVEERLLRDDRVMEVSVYQESNKAVVVAVPKGCIETTDALSAADRATLAAELLELANQGVGDDQPRVSRIDIISLAELPLGCTGKVKKRDLRSRAQTNSRKRAANG